MQGPHGNYQVPQTGTKLVDDLSKAKWFGKAIPGTLVGPSTPVPQGAKTPQDRAQKIRDILGPNPKNTPGGWAAPILAEGKVFATTFKPAGKLYRRPGSPCQRGGETKPDHGQGSPRGG